MSDSEDDFMSDKFLLNLPSSSSSSNKKSYSESRNSQQLKSMRKGQSKNQVPLKQLEEERRREGLSKSLFEQPDAVASGSGGGVAMGLMKKMGWNVGESLGKKRSSPPPHSSASQFNAKPQEKGMKNNAKRPKFLPGDEEEEEEDEDRPKRGIANGIGSSSRIEPIRISMWSGRRGLTARSPSPPPLPKATSGRDPDALDEKKLERLGKQTEGFRDRQRAEYTERERERKGRAAREKLVEYDKEKGIKFHPLHIVPFSPLTTLPKPLLKIVYPAQAYSPSPEPESSTAVEGFERESNLSAAEKLREQMRKDMLSTLAGDEEDNDEGVIRFGLAQEDESLAEAKKLDKQKDDEYRGVNWQEHVQGAKRVLSMDPATYLQFVVDQLRHEYLFCFWCAYKYATYGEMEGPGGCPGEDEDDH
ncbi:uncharacterized protein IL334_006990 [Kwoniella shivajii]|uniref:DUF4187 domain-containing protein n=1 Tax=Kwoniella shivajii TaxID=564305 RepID=A0ABZ1D7I2_9TREE|nr:hypothetical protein IL334_006990 [Kwoniella shivajii]